MDFLYHLLDQSQYSIVTAFILGLLTAISPCPLATNITAIGFISKNIEDRTKIFYNGLWYTLGRALSYSVLGVVLYLGASKFHVAKIFQPYGERWLGPLLILIGVVMLDLIKINLLGFASLREKLQPKAGSGSWHTSLLLGVVFALAFCPYSGVLFFGMLIPISITSVSGLVLPIVFAVATGLPVLVIAWLLAFSISSIGVFYNRIKLFELWFRRVIALAFIVVGCYYMYIFFS